MCGSLCGLCYGRVRSSAVHIFFASYGGMSFVLVALGGLDVGGLGQ